ncbi:hypothetical protein H0H93_010188 [Arthromyces matolae]|nr:hypothetical protein H0H93_010188 [Arthromyces matolae]
MHPFYSSMPYETPPSTPPPDFYSDHHGLDNVLRAAEERIYRELVRLRLTCSKALADERKPAEKLQAQSLIYQRERDLAWAKVQSLMGDQLGLRRLPLPRRSRSCGPVLGRPLRPSSSSASKSRSTIQPLETVAEDDPWKRLYPEEMIVHRDVSHPPLVVSLPHLKRCHSETSLPRSRPLKLVTLPDGRKVASISAPRSGTLVATDDHLDVIYRQHNRSFVCRVCILKQDKIWKETRRDSVVSSFHVDTPVFELHNHSLGYHMDEMMELLKLPQSTLLEMKEGLARTERDEDFDLSYL